MTVSIIIFIVLSVIVPGCLAEYCGGGGWCSSGEYCCGTYDNYCCSSWDTSYTAGIVTSTLIVGGIVVCLIICCCNQSCYLSKRYRGHVIQTNAPAASVVVQQQTTQLGYVPGYGQGYPPSTQLSAQGYPQHAAPGYPQSPPAPGLGYQPPPPATAQDPRQTAAAPGNPTNFQPQGFVPTPTGYSNQGFASDPPKYQEANAPVPPPYSTGS